MDTDKQTPVALTRDEIVALLLDYGFEEVIVRGEQTGATRWIPLRDWQPYGRIESQQGINIQGELVRFYYDSNQWRRTGEACIRETNVPGMKLSSRTVWPIRSAQSLRRTV